MGQQIKLSFTVGLHRENSQVGSQSKELLQNSIVAFLQVQGLELLTFKRALEHRNPPIYTQLSGQIESGVRTRSSNAVRSQKHPLDKSRRVKEDPPTNAIEALQVAA